jgi:hypothetical protein
MSLFSRVSIMALAVFTVAGLASKADDKDWTPLFNGTDLKGWKVHPNPHKDVTEISEKKVDGKVVAIEAKVKNERIPLWRVENGTIIGGGPPTHLFTERDDFENFHFLIEAKINDKGNSGQYFRTAFGPGFPKGYEAQINATHGDEVKTGSLYPNPGFGMAKFRDKITVLKDAPHKPDEFFTQEVIANGPKITILVNGKKTIEFEDPEHRFKKGHFALQAHDPGSIMTFRKILVKEIK